MNLLISWLVLSLAVWITAALLPGFHVKGFGNAVIVAAIFGVLNTLFGWLLFGVLAIATLGLGLLFAFITIWIVNAIMLKITDAFTSRLKIDNFGWALLGALVISLISSVLSNVLQ